MRVRVLRRPEVYYDVIEAAEYIARDSPAAALRFFDGIEETLITIAEGPGMGAMRQFESPRLQKLRSWAVTGFPNYLVFYQWEEPDVVVVALIHGARNLPPILDKRV